jgi:excisionase family DNA binding protein
MNRTQVTPDKPYARLKSEARARKAADESSGSGEESEGFLTARQLAEVLQVSESTVRRLARDGRIPSVRLTPRILRFNLKAVCRALDGAVMAKLVVDSSVAVKWFIPEPYSAQARHILDGYHDGTLSFLAPDLLNAEFGNILWKKHAFQGLGADDARDILTAFRALQFTFVPTESLLRDAFRISLSHRRTVYDSLYVALSVREGCQLVTADEKLANAISTTFPNVVWVADWP